MPEWVMDKLSQDLERPGSRDRTRGLFARALWPLSAIVDCPSTALQHPRQMFMLRRSLSSAASSRAFHSALKAVTSRDWVLARAG